MISRAFGIVKSIFEGDLDLNPTKLTAIQSILVTILASILAVACYQTVGVYYPGVWYQLFVTLFIASILAPVFLYPTFKTSERLRQAKLTIEKQAITDHLTGLPNMIAFSSKLEEVLQDIEKKDSCALHFIDLDRFKLVNDSFGHETGNELLRQVSRNLRKFIGTSGFLARYGGDEFVAIQYSAANESEAISFAEKLRQAVSKCNCGLCQEVSVGATVGTALIPQHGAKQDELLVAADLALYRAKRLRAPHQMYEPTLSEHAQKRRKIEGALKSAISNGSLKPYFHSIVNLENPLQIKGFEALARIEMPNGEMLRPDEFIPVAEHTGMILEIGEYMLNQACLECVSWHPDLYVAVNVSPVQLIRSDFPATVHQALTKSGLSPDRLELEITESVLIDDVGQIGSVLARLREMGIRIALDDFGSGFCGLHYLRQLEIDKIKIDKTIVDDAGTVQISTNILKSVAQIAQDMGLTVTAEGVDSLAKAEFLTSEICAQEMQGYLFSKPVSAKQAFRMQEIMNYAKPGSRVVNMADTAKLKQVS